MKSKKVLAFISALIVLPCLIYAKSNIIYKGVYEISKSINESNKTYSSNSNDESAILVTDGNSVISSAKITKTGSSSGDDADFYGINACVLVKNGNLDVSDSVIETNGSHANAVFAYDKGVINISNSTINTSSNNSGGIMVTGGGTINANNLTITTTGNSSAPIRSDRGGGTITVNGGTYTSNGVGSPSIYSTADIKVSNAKLISNTSSGVVIEGDNSITLNNVDLYDNNIKSNTKGEEVNYKNIFIYQSTSGDAKDGTGVFTSQDSKITTDNGSTIFVTNTNAIITLENNEIINNANGPFLKAGAARWGKSGSNGGKVTLNLINQTVSGDIVLDNISTLNMVIKDSSIYSGSINKDNNSNNVKLTISKDSIFSLTSDTYLTSLDNENNSNSNIYSNGYNLYVNGKKVSINGDNYTNESINKQDKTNTSENEIISENNTNETDTNEVNNEIYHLIVGFSLVIITFIVIILILKK